MGNIAVSVIMPSLNVGLYIDECISSVRQQTMADIEILCVDAGSTDGTLEILQHHALEDSRITILNSPVKSYGHQVNMGISRAKGEYISIIETDDYVPQEMLEKLYSLAKKDNLDYAKGNFEGFLTHEGHRRFYKYSIFPAGSDRYNSVLCPGEDETLPIRDYSIWRGIYKTSFLLDNNIQCNESKGAAYQDIGFTLQVYDKAKKCAYIEDTIYYYQLDRDGASSCKAEVLQFVEAEFRRLFADNLVRKSKAIYIRLIYAIIPETEKLLRKYDFEINEEYISKPLIWLKTQVEEALSTGIVCQEDIEESVWERLQLLLKDMDGFAKECKKIYDQEQTLRAQRIAPFKGRAAIIFGSGVYGRKNILELEQLGIVISCVCDNDTAKTGTELLDYQILTPEQAHKKYPLSAFVIPDRPYKDEMVQQAERIGAEFVIL